MFKTIARLIVVCILMLVLTIEAMLKSIVFTVMFCLWIIGVLLAPITANIDWPLLVDNTFDYAFSWKFQLTKRIGRAYIKALDI